MITTQRTFSGLYKATVKDGTWRHVMYATDRTAVFNAALFILAKANLLIRDTYECDDCADTGEHIGVSGNYEPCHCVL